MEDIGFIIENYKTLTRDIGKIERKNVFLKSKRKELEEKIIEHYQTHHIESINNLQLISSVRKEALSRKYLDRIIAEYYSEYYTHNKIKFGGNKDNMERFTQRKSKKLIDYIFSKRSSNIYFRLHQE